MPSTQLFFQSGGIGLVSGAIYSGSPRPVGGVQLLYSNTAQSGPIYIGLPNLSGDATTAASGGSLSSGGLADGMEMIPGNSYFVPKVRLVSGIESIRVLVPAPASGARLFWEPL